jgi:hypothetical protein
VRLQSSDQITRVTQLSEKLPASSETVACINNANDYTQRLSLSIPYTHTGGAEVEIHSFLIGALDGGEWSASRCGRSTPGNKARYPLRRGLDDSEGKNLLHQPGSEPWIVQPVAVTTLTTSRLASDYTNVILAQRAPGEYRAPTKNTFQILHHEMFCTL